MKTCGNCHETKSSQQFGWKHKATGKRQSFCKICARVYCRRYYRKEQEDVSTLISQRASLSRLAGEIAKCEVRCANCHRKRTARVRGYWKGEAVSGETMPPVAIGSPQNAW